jgi:sulfatase modifying factor 1
MAVTPVTNETYRRYLADTGDDPPPWLDDSAFDDDDQPVVGVNWEQARSFCRWLSELSGLSVRLPTEAEREKAARGGVEGRLFPWGDAIDGGGHGRLNGPLDGPERVATTPANGYGLYNLGDTVHEWCLDAYHEDFYHVSPNRNPCAFGGNRRAARGGSWRHQIVVTPCSARSSLPPTFHYADFGFRWIVDLT